MEALQFTGKTKKLDYVKIPIPEITGPDQVLIKVSYCGVCGTDLHIMAGEFPCHDDTRTLGHEFSGIIADLGSDVVHLKKGDRVALDPNGACRCCDYCHAGKPHFCEEKGNGIFNNGGWANYVLSPMSMVTKLPDSLSLEQGALTEPLSCLSHGWDLISPVPVGSRILIMGAGIIGNLWASVLHLQGHRKVTVSEPNSQRLNGVKKLDTGFTLVTPDQLQKNKEADPKYRFDVVVDCSGNCPAIEGAISLLDKGGKLCCFGCAPTNGKITVTPFELYEKELTIYAVKVNPFSFVKALGLMEAMGSRYLDYEKLGIQIFELKDYEKALEILKSGKISKAVFKLS